MLCLSGPWPAFRGRSATTNHTTGRPNPRRMKLKFLLVWLAGMLLLSVAHVQFNLGWSEFARSLRESFGLERRQLQVGFLPVT
jgi:hypothetical protein